MLASETGKTISSLMLVPFCFQKCDASCEKGVKKTSPCGFPYKVCKVKRVKKDCPRNKKSDAVKKLPKPLKCYHPMPKTVRISVLWVGEC